MRHDRHLAVTVTAQMSLRQRDSAHRGHQNIGKKVRRNPDEATVMKRPTVGEGVEL